jgi:hypothetical protein
VKNLTVEEIDELLNPDLLAQQAADFVEMEHNSKIFRNSALRRFLTTMLAETNPTLSIATNSLEYYHQVFCKFILARTCFAFWDVERNSDYDHYPEALKMDKFIEHAWKINFEDDVKAKFIYNLQ